MRKTRTNEEIYIINQDRCFTDLIKFYICGTTFPSETYQISRPESEIYCIEYIEEGCGTVSLDGQIFHPKANDSYFLHANKSQFYFSDKSNPWKKHFVNLSGRLVDQLAAGYGIDNVAYFQNLDIKNELMQIREIAQRDEMHKTEKLIAILNAIFLKMHLHIKGRDEPSTIASEMKSYLSSQVTSKFRIEDLCRHISKSESQAIRIFKNAYGITPYNFVLDKKIEFAKKLLTDTGLSVKQIAEKLCFADEYYFSNVFKKKTGFTPSSYRRKNDADDSKNDAK